MCGIMGYIGEKFVDSVLLVGLERLEYRGYDSAGIATISEGGLFFRKTVGKIKFLDQSLKQSPLGGNIGIGHTRWATHGESTENNAHPHLDCEQKIAVVHNGIIENYISLKEELIKAGHVFVSETDSEVVPHLIESYAGKMNFLEAVLKTVNRLDGSYALAVISEIEPDKIYTVRNKCPLVIGLGNRENMVASDISPLLTHTRNAIFLNDGEVGVISRSEVKIFNYSGEQVKREPVVLDTAPVQYEKQNFRHFMLKEIHEQPQVAQKIISERVGADNLVHFKERTIKREALAKVGRIIIQACGTSWHAGLIGKVLLEKFAKIPAEAEISSEFRYRNPIMEGDTLVVALSQSGETADTLAGIREVKSHFTKVLSFVNVMNSTIAKESDCAIDLMAGPEIGVASTKAYISQLVNLYLFTIYLSRIKWTLNESQVKDVLEDIKKVPGYIEKILKKSSMIPEYAKKYSQSPLVIFLGRGLNYPTALEGALKLKEISYLHSAGYPAGEFKHGPIALVDDKVLVVCILTKGELYNKMLSNVHEVRARKGKILAVATEGDEEVRNVADAVIYVPECPEYISPMLTVVPLQMFAYYIALERGCDVDRPRNLAKSVTVE